jgi:hypothetical protein
MRGWPLVFAIVGGAAIVALALRALPAGVVIVAALAAVAFASVRMRKVARSSRRGGAAQTLGFRMATTDPFALLSLPLALFARGSEHEIGDVMWGSWAGIEVKLFRLAFTDAVAIRRRFSCALAPSPVPSPALVVEPRTFMLPIPGDAPLPEIRIDDDALARALDVRGDDPGHATSLVSASVGPRLVAWQERWAFELRDRMLLCYSSVEDVDPLESLETVTTLYRLLAERGDAPAPEEATPPRHPGPRPA